MTLRTPLVAALAVALLALPAAAAAAAPTPGLPPPAGGLSVAALLGGRITLVKADAPVDMTVQTLRVYAYESTVRRGDTTIATSRSWIVRRTGPDPRYGVFAPVTATSHAGGHVVTATVSQQQLLDASSRTFLPLTITTRTGPGVATSTVTGSTVLRVDALTVDGAPVDVGPSCVTSAALAIRLVADPGWTDLQGGFLRGTFTVPPFTGCDGAVRGTGARVTAAFSGRGNSVVLTRGAAGTWDTTAPRDCEGCGRPPAIG